jgi:hypothetical protein
MVLAGALVTFAARLAALPVGATTCTSQPRDLAARTSAEITVVLPAPGRPVRTKTRDASARRTASRCASERVEGRGTGAHTGQP